MVAVVVVVVVVVVLLLLLLPFCHRLLLSERSELRASLDSSNALEVLLHLGSGLKTPTRLMQNLTNVRT